MSTFDLYRYVYGKSAHSKRSSKIYSLYRHEKLLWFRESPMGLSSYIRGTKVLKSPKCDFLSGFVLADHIYYRKNLGHIIGENVVPSIITSEQYNSSVDRIEYGVDNPVLQDVSIGNLKFTLIKHPTTRSVVIKLGDGLFEFELPRGVPISI